MGYYTELKTEIKVKNDEDVFYALRWIMDMDRWGGEGLKKPSAEHEFFDKPRAQMIFTCDWDFEPILKSDKDFIYLKTSAQIKNYEKSIDSFISWITPYVQEGLLDGGAFAETRGGNSEGYWKHSVIEGEYNEEYIADPETKYGMGITITERRENIYSMLPFPKVETFQDLLDLAEPYGFEKIEKIESMNKPEVTVIVHCKKGQKNKKRKMKRFINKLKQRKMVYATIIVNGRTI